MAQVGRPKKPKIKIGFVGVVRYMKENMNLIRQMKNNGKYEFVYIGKTYPECNLEKTCKNENIENVTFKGDVYWHSHNNSGGMHVFIAEYPENSNLNLPIDEVEGILAFKHKDWIFNENNKGIISNIPIFLKKMLMTNTPLEFTFYYDENEIIKSYTFNQI